jgi:hypothetical protein
MIKDPNANMLQRYHESDIQKYVRKCYELIADGDIAFNLIEQGKTNRKGKLLLTAGTSIEGSLTTLDGPK